MNHHIVFGLFKRVKKYFTSISRCHLHMPFRLMVQNFIKYGNDSNEVNGSSVLKKMRYIL